MNNYDCYSCSSDSEGGVEEGPGFYEVREEQLGEHESAIVWRKKITSARVARANVLVSIIIRI